MKLYYNVPTYKANIQYIILYWAVNTSTGIL